jgi:hypothetical protein
MKAVFTFKIIDNYGEITTCNMIEPLNKPISRINDRIKDLQSKGFYITGNVTLQFVEEDR